MEISSENQVNRGMEVFAVSTEEPTPCSSCGNWRIGKYRVPGISGVFCSVGCLETELFGQKHCRWCGRPMENPYTSIEARLCSENCSVSYWKHVKGDRSAALGSGKRFVGWLQENSPRAFAMLMGNRA